VWQGRWREAESAYARSAVSCAVRRTFSTAFGQQDTTAHRIFIFPLHAIVQLHAAALSYPAESADIASEYSIELCAAQAQLTIFSISDCVFLTISSQRINSISHYCLQPSDIRRQLKLKICNEKLSRSVAISWSDGLCDNLF
jgi:hypothetical protein